MWITVGRSLQAGAGSERAREGEIYCDPFEGIRDNPEYRVTPLADLISLELGKLPREMSAVGGVSALLGDGAWPYRL